VGRPANSIRLIDPSMPEGAYLENTTQQEAAGLPIFAFNPDGEPIDVINHYVNFGWEYVLHCHILSHEEMDMMHAQIVGVAPSKPEDVTFTRVGNGANRRYDISWTDTSKNDTAFVVERRVEDSTDDWTTVATIPSAQFGVVPFVETGVGPETGDPQLQRSHRQHQHAVRVPRRRPQHGRRRLGLLGPGVQRDPTRRRVPDPDPRQPRRRHHDDRRAE
jgi:hypothetical protein